MTFSIPDYSCWLLGFLALKGYLGNFKNAGGGGGGGGGGGNLQVSTPFLQLFPMKFTSKDLFIPFLFSSMPQSQSCTV